MLDMRRREEAEGERRMIGSGRRGGFPRCVGNVVLGAFDAVICCGFLDMKSAENLRT